MGDPVHIHELVAGELLQDGDGGQVHGAAQRGADAPQAAAPADGEEDGHSRLTAVDLIIARRFQHGDGDGAEHGADGQVGEDGAHEGAGQEPDGNLGLHGRPHQ